MTGSSFSASEFITATEDCINLPDINILSWRKYLLRFTEIGVTLLFGY
jgi:hypothetical protein